MPNPVCIPCARAMKRERCGIVVELRAENLGDKPYQQWMADLFVCPGCGAQIASGYGFEPIWQHFRERGQMRAHVSVREEAAVNAS